MVTRLSTPDEQFNKTLEFLREKVFPKLDDDNLIKYSLKMRKWFNDQLGSILDDYLETKKETLPPPRGDETESRWGKPGWGEMGG